MQDLQAGRATKMAGYLKIKGCCAQAFVDGWQYAWIDSCCIDKTSSAELSESINSMFQWYKDAQVCYAYLADVPTEWDSRRHHTMNSRFRCSKWFTRGWTLQELLAPENVVFYNCAWEEIGTKWSLEKLISSITGIYHFKNIGAASVAQKMSWASKRETTRLEDQAYCLLGLFGVNMAPLYGEGINAFHRLQLEILGRSDDESIFAWTQVPEPYASPPPEGLLAPSLAEFAQAGDVVRSVFDKDRPPFSMTNKGLRIELFLVRTRPEDTFLAPLNCAKDGRTVALSLRSFAGRFYREGPLDSVKEMGRYSEKTPFFANKHSNKRTLLFIEQKTRPFHPGRSNFEWGGYGRRPRSCAITTDSLLKHGYIVFQELVVDTPERPNSTRTLQVKDYGEREGGFRFNLHMFSRYEGAFLHFTSSGSEDFVIVLWAVSLFAETEVVTTNILIPGNHSLLDIFHVFMETAPSLRQSDRASIFLPSGKSVSVAIRLRGESGTPFYVCDVIIDSEGRLPWADVS